MLSVIFYAGNYMISYWWFRFILAKYVNLAEVLS